MRCRVCMRGLGRLAMFRRDRRGRGGRLRWRVRGGTNGMGGCRRVVRVLLACRRVCLCRLSWCPCLSVGHPPIALRPPGGLRLGFVFECSGRSPPAVQVCLLGRRMFTRVGRSPFVFVSFIRCTPAITHGALPTFPCVLPAECNSLRGHASIKLCTATICVAFVLLLAKR